MLGNRKFWSVISVTALYIFAIYQSNPVWTLIFCVAALLAGKTLGLSLIELLVISVQFAMYIDFGLNVNFTPSLIILGIIVLNPSFWKEIISSKGMQFFAKWFFIWFFSFLAILVFSIFTNGIQGELRNWLDVSKLVLGCLFLLVTVKVVLTSSAPKLLNLVKVWVFTSTLIAFVGIAAYFAEMIHPTLYSQQFLYSSTRLKGTFEDPNLYAVSILISIGMTFVLTHISGRRIFLAPLVILSVALAMTNSRGALISLVLMGLVGLLLFLRRWTMWREWAFKISISSIAFFLTIPTVSQIQDLYLNYSAKLFYILFVLQEFFTNTSAGATVSTTGNPEQDTAPNDPVNTADPNTPVISYAVRSDISGDVRFTLWITAIKMWIAHPFNGVGYGDYPRNTLEYSGGKNLGVLFTHNTYLSFLAETGFFGFALICAPVVIAFILLLKARNFISLAICSTLIGVVTMSFAYNLQNSQMYWICIGIGISIGLKCLQEKVQLRIKVSKYD